MMENKKIKVIDLLNMLANEERDQLPAKIKLLGKVYVLDKIQPIEYSSYMLENESNYDVGKLPIDLNKPWLNEEITIIEEPILTDEEKEYLSTVIKPFRDRIKNISKYKSEFGERYGYREYIHINFIENDSDCGLELPSFPENTMYKQIVLYEEYTLEELGL